MKPDIFWAQKNILKIDPIGQVEFFFIKTLESRISDALSIKLDKGYIFALKFTAVPINCHIALLQRVQIRGWGKGEEWKEDRGTGRKKAHSKDARFR